MAIPEASSSREPGGPALPPRYVEYASAEPAAFSLATKTSKQGDESAVLRQVSPEKTAWIGLTVGKFLESVLPVI